MLMFDEKCVAAVKAEIEKQLQGNKPVTRKTVVKALSIGTSKDEQDAAELGISVMFKLGLLPEYRALQKLGIKPADYVSKRQAQKSKSDSAAAEPSSPAENEEPTAPASGSDVSDSKPAETASTAA